MAISVQVGAFKHVTVVFLQLQIFLWSAGGNHDQKLESLRRARSLNTCNWALALLAGSMRALLAASMASFP